MIKKLNILIIILSIFTLSSQSLQSNEVKIIKKIDNEVITNIDIQMEALYLIALNPKFKEVNRSEMLNLAENSLIKEKIKKIELLKIFDLEKKQIVVTNYMEKISASLGYENKEEFTKYLQNAGLKYEEIYKKINIELAWNEFIYSKYKDQIKVNEIAIKEKLKTKKNKQKIYNLSEIVFSASTKSDLKKKLDELMMNISELGFEKTAFLYSEAATQKKSGLIGWVNENQLSKKFKKELTILNEGQITNPISISSGKIILKINEIKNNTSPVNTEEQLKKIILMEKDRQLNNFSIIYYNKVKNKLLN